jgi:hypothetical protein
MNTNTKAIELFRTLAMLHECREAIEDGENFGATLGEADALADIYTACREHRN